MIAQVVMSIVPVLTCALHPGCVHGHCLFLGSAWVSLRARSSFSNFYTTAAPGSWWCHTSDISDEPGTPSLGKSLVIQVQKAVLAGKYLCIDNSGIPDMKLNTFSCFFSASHGIAQFISLHGTSQSTKVSPNWPGQYWTLERTAQHRISRQTTLSLFPENSEWGSKCGSEPRASLQRYRWRLCVPVAESLCKGWLKMVQVYSEMGNEAGTGRQSSWVTACCSVTSYFFKGAPGRAEVQCSQRTGHTRPDQWDWQLVVLIHVNPLTLNLLCVWDRVCREQPSVSQLNCSAVTCWTVNA